ncbi:hypothetical protein NST28_15945 [Paenibacillus sp. FSL R10-2791]
MLPNPNDHAGLIADPALFKESVAIDTTNKVIISFIIIGDLMGM